MSSAVQRQELFLRLPSPLRRGLVAWQSFSNRHTRYGAEYRRTVAALEESQSWSAERLRDLQKEQLARLLQEARAGTEHYAEAFSSLSEAALRNLAEDLALHELPLLEKATLKAETARFANRLRRTVVTSSTSGSTGSPLRVGFDRASLEQRFAHLHRHRSWAGLRPFARNLRLSGRQLVPTARTDEDPWMLAPFENMLLVSTYHLDERHLSRIVERANRFRPELLDGYPTAIDQLARFCASRGLRIPSLRVAITTAETLHPELRQSIEDGLGVRVFDYYAASEGVPFICQCEHGRYHPIPESGLFEFLDPQGRPASPGSEAEIVVTSFCQWKTPLIRYRTGDMVRLPDDPQAPCPCGRAFPMAAELLGRVEDQVLTRDGRRLGMFPYRTLKHVGGLREAQIVQTGFESFRLVLVPDGTCPLAEIHRDAAAIFSSVIGYEVQVELKAVPAVARGPNGKLRALVRAFAPEPGSARKSA